MSSFNETLAQAASKNHELLSILSQTDYAPPALKQNTAYISDLQSQITKVDKRLKELHFLTEEERKEHLKYSESKVKRLAYRLGGSKGKEKFSEKEEKEEREFLEAWQKEREAKESREELSKALSKAESDKTGLESDKARNDQAQNELDRLYNSIFSGPTPDYPVEDQMEASVQRASEYTQQCHSQLGTEKHAFDALTEADKHVQRAQQNMGSALGHSQWDMMGGGMFNDMMERDRLSQAQVNLSQASRHMDEATRTQPAIQSLSNVNIDMGHMLSDVMFDSIFTDYAQHQRIKESDGQLQRANQQLHAQMREQENRVENAHRQLKGAQSDLENARQELQNCRSAAFERLSNGGVGGASQPPPAYSVAQ